MNSTRNQWVALIVVAIIAIGGLFSPVVRSQLGAVSSATTFLPSFGLGTLDVGSGCGNQYTNCTPAISISAGTTTLGTQGVATYYTLGGVDYATVQTVFATTATNSPAFVGNPFGTATTSFGWDGIMVQFTSGPLVDWTWDIATTTSPGAATTSAVLVKAQVTAAGTTYDDNFYSFQATTTASTFPAGILPGDNLNPGNHFGGSNWFLRGGVLEGIHLRVASTTVGQTAVGTMSETFKKP